MEGWFGTPQIVTVILGAAAVLLSVGIWVGGVNKDRKHLKDAAAQDRKTMHEFMKEIRADIKEIRVDLKEIFKRLPDPFLGKASPVTLTKRGEEAARRIKAHHWAARTASTLAERVEGKREFEVYSFCQEYVNEMSGQGTDIEMLDRVRECAYEYASKVSEILPILAVVLRDEILKRTSD